MGGMEKGDVLGHEFMGLVEEVGPEVKTLSKGDRVVVSAVIADGTCFFCKNGMFSCCDTTNPSKEMEKTYGHRLSGIFGYSHLTGGYDGGQAEYVRVPYADVNCLKVPSTLRDEQVLLLSDVACTAWHANEMGEVTEGKTVAVWGCGPVGLMSLAWAKFRGATTLIAIDELDYRLEMAKTKIGGVHVINFTRENVLETIRKLLPGGPDVCIDAAGFRFPGTSLLHKIERTLGLETDSPVVLTEAILACRKGGIVSIIGDYFAYANQFPIGPMMEKSLTVRGGQVFVQKYWKQLLGYIEAGKVDPTFIITHHLPLSRADVAYRMFDKREDNIVKVILRPDATTKEE